MSEPPLLPGMVTVAQAQDVVRSAALTPEPERVALDKALGRVLAEAVVASRDQPPFDASAMDGYAVRRTDLSEDRTFKVIGESAAGRRFTGTVGEGEAIRIFTGAPVPPDCDAVVIQENVAVSDDGIRILPDGSSAKVSHIRPAGQDFRSGDGLLEAGVRLDPWRLSLAAAAGAEKLRVARRPVIAVLGTGDELVPPGGDPKPDQIYDSASHAVMAMIRQWGGKPRHLGIGGDSKKAVLKALKSAEADLIVTIGGASVGDHDVVKPALTELGLTLHIDGIKVRPGKPTSFGVLDDGRRVLGLPGNPASAFVMAQLILKPWIEASLGIPLAQALFPVRAAVALPDNGPREAWLRAVLSVDEVGQFTVLPFAEQDSSLVTVFARADALIRRPAGAPSVEAGGLVDVLPLDRL